MALPWLSIGSGPANAGPAVRAPKGAFAADLDLGGLVDHAYSIDEPEP